MTSKDEFKMVKELHERLSNARNSGGSDIHQSTLDDLIAGKLSTDELSKLVENIDTITQCPVEGVGGSGKLYDKGIMIPVTQSRNIDLSLGKEDVMMKSVKGRKTMIKEATKDLRVIGGRAKYLNNEKYKVLNWIYFHGEIETKLGYDIVYIDRFRNPEEIKSNDSLHLRVININTNDVYDAIGFFWKNSNGVDRGLIVDANDYEGIVYAVKKKEEKSDIL